ncbi:microcin C7 resistance protein MccF-like protein [Sphingobacterium allocomposti]|uniref:microcin C7 resistance protein MccF-like protein n=1 Tax=Sphingobacterium allocomposti TaxID=415956 RepID=UPI0011E66C2E|nr:microcin C7 resistance protein MccF-like protein [Sphingobacterium composti Yoo et al. 2007 non Ten et al. 2007]
MRTIRTPLIYILEDNAAEDVNNVQNQLQALLLQPIFRRVTGIVIGRFRKESKMTREVLTKIIRTKDELTSIPVIANVDFGHTIPTVTLPIGGTLRISGTGHTGEIHILRG